MHLVPGEKYLWWFKGKFMGIATALSSTQIIESFGVTSIISPSDTFKLCTKLDLLFRAKNTD